MLSRLDGCLARRLLQTGYPAGRKGISWKRASEFVRFVEPRIGTISMSSARIWNATLSRANGRTPAFGAKSTFSANANPGRVPELRRTRQELRWMATVL